MALWRANGYARTTVADICRAAGVSKALFYFYFPRKEDVLFEVGVVSTDAAHNVATEMLAKPYEIPAVITAVLASLESTMRHEHAGTNHRGDSRGLPAGARRPRPSGADICDLCGGVRAAPKQRRQAAEIRSTLHVRERRAVMVSEGARHWAAGTYGDRSSPEVVGRDITALVEGYGSAQQS